MGEQINNTLSYTVPETVKQLRENSSARGLTFLGFRVFFFLKLRDFIHRTIMQKYYMGRVTELSPRNCRAVEPQGTKEPSLTYSCPYSELATQRGESLARALTQYKAVSGYLIPSSKPQALGGGMNAPGGLRGLADPCPSTLQAWPHAGTERAESSTAWAAA